MSQKHVSSVENKEKTRYFGEIDPEWMRTAAAAWAGLINEVTLNTKEKDLPVWRKAEDKALLYVTV